MVGWGMGLYAVNHGIDDSWADDWRFSYFTALRLIIADFIIYSNMTYD